MFKKTLLSVSVAALTATADVAPMAVSAADATDFSIQLAKCNPCSGKKGCNPCGAKKGCKPCAAKKGGNPCAAKK